MTTDLPLFEGHRQILSPYEGGQWKVPAPGTNGEDNHGDGTIIEDPFHGLHRMVWRSGGTLLGGVYNEKPLDKNPWDNWPGIPGGPGNPTKVFVSTDATNAGNMDTWSIFVNPLTGVVHVFAGVKPGNRAIVLPEGTGTCTTQQSWTSTSPHAGHAHMTNGDKWTPNSPRHEAAIAGIFDPHPTWTGVAWQKPRTVGGGPEIQGGQAEASYAYDPIAEEVVMVYENKATGNTEWGTVWKNRLGKRTAPIAGFDASPDWTDQPALGVDTWIWNVEDDPDYLDSDSTGSPDVKWGTEPGLTPRGHYSIDPEGGHHYVGINRIPDLLAAVNRRTVGIGHWHSPTGLKGTWTQDNRNPIIIAGSRSFDPRLANAPFAHDFSSEFPVHPNQGWNKLNSPYLMWSTINVGAVYLGWWAAPIQMNKIGTRFWMAVGNTEPSIGWMPRLSADEDEELDVVIGPETKLWEATQHGVRRK